MPPNTKKCDGTCRTPECYTASTEEWVNRVQKAIDIFHGEKGKECPICGVNPKKWIEELASHDQQLRQRIVEWAEKNQSEDVIWCSSLKHFITNLK